VNRSISAFAKITLVFLAILSTAVLIHPGVDMFPKSPNGLTYRSLLRVSLSLSALFMPGTWRARACELDGAFSVRSEKHGDTKLVFQISVSGEPA
jgi:hypothetical protein